MGWVYGFKLHLICNEKGELLNFMLTPGNVVDRDPLNNKYIIKDIFGKLVGDKGYFSNTLFNKLFVDGIQLITKLKKNMRGCLMTIGDKLLIHKRTLIETNNTTNFKTEKRNRLNTVMMIENRMMPPPKNPSFAKAKEYNALCIPHPGCIFLFQVPSCKYS